MVVRLCLNGLKPFHINFAIRRFSGTFGMLKVLRAQRILGSGARDWAVQALTCFAG